MLSVLTVAMCSGYAVFPGEGGVCLCQRRSGRGPHSRWPATSEERRLRGIYLPFELPVISLFVEILISTFGALEVFMTMRY